MVMLEMGVTTYINMFVPNKNYIMKDFSRPGRFYSVYKKEYK